MKKYHYVYLITNKQTNKKYIGKHSTDNLEDGYMGSGVIIQKILKNNPASLKKEILEMCSSEEESYEKEKYWIQYYNAYQSSDFYNLTEGGQGNSSQLMKDRWKDGIYGSNEYRQKQSIIMKDRMQNDQNLKTKRKEGWQQWWNNLTPEEKDQWARKKEKNGMYGKHHTEEALLKNKQHQPNLKKLYCEEEPDLIFLGTKDAAKWCGLKENSYAAISRCINGKQKTAGTHPITKQRCHWHVYTEEE